MVHQHYFAERSSSSSSSLTSPWIMFPYTIPSQDEEPALEFNHFPLPSSLNSSDRYRNDMNQSQFPPKDELAASASYSTLFTNNDRHFPESYGSTSSVYGLGSNPHVVTGGVYDGHASLMDESWITPGYSRGVSSPSWNESELATDSVNDSWGSGVSNGDSQEISALPPSIDESSDRGNQGRLGQNPAYDPAKLESMWTEPTPCFLGGCKAGRLFRTSKSWHSHVKNVHKKTLHCLEPDCVHAKPFANNTDLKRHIETIHDGKKPFKCERANCSRTVKAWPRKDKLRLHNKKYHSNYRCFFCSQDPRHQRWFDTATELWVHTIDDHPNG